MTTGESDAIVAQAGAGDAIVARIPFDARRDEHRIERRGHRFYFDSICHAVARD